MPSERSYAQWTCCRGPPQSNGFRRPRSPKVLLHPLVDGRLHFREVLFKEMIRVFHQNQALGIRNRFDHSFQVFLGAELIARATDKEFGFGTALEKLVGVRPPFHGYGRAQGDQADYPLVGTRSAQPSRSSK